MFIDTKAVENDSVIRTDICVVGAGPAGIAMARALIGSGFSVSVLESGGLDTNASALGQPAKGSVFPENRGIWTTRQFGGNANLWHVDTGTGPHNLRLLPMAEADFDERDWIADSGWPIAKRDLDPYYARAQEWFELHGTYAPEEWASPAAPQLALDDSGLKTGMFHFADRNVALHKYRQEIGEAHDVRLYYNATATRIDADPETQRVTSVSAAGAPGQTVTFEADVIVLALGGLATPQLLLASNGQQEAGLGNAHDLVGRYFIDHPLLFGGTFTPTSPQLINAMALYDLRRVNGMAAMGHIQLADETLRTERCLNLSTILFPRRRMSARREAGFQASQRLRSAMRGDAKWKTADIFRAICGADGVFQQFRDRIASPISHLGIGGWSRQSNPAETFTHFEVLHQAEQAPHRDNRILLSNERDALGNRRIEIQWKWHDEDIAMIHKAQDLVALGLRRAGLGEFAIQRPFEIKTSSTTHFMGTTRMHADPKKGVVDASCRVHGVDNLFVASSSAFPSGGFANPTLSIVAMSLRIADEVKRSLGNRRAVAQGHAEALTMA